MATAFTDFDTWFLKVQLDASVRARIYKTLAMFLRNNVLLVDALGDMYAVMSEDGKKPRRPAAAMLYECRQMVSEGHSFSDAIRKWVSPTEAALIAAGEKAGNLSGAFADALSLIATTKEIRGTVIGKSILPAANFAALATLLYIVAYKLVPSLQHAAPPETWTGAARLMYLASEFVKHYGVISVLLFAGAIAGIFVSFPRLCGTLRYHLDKLPPWSVYRVIAGAIALQNIAVLIRSGVKQHDALKLLSDNATPYLRERVDAALYGTTKGLNLGQALEASEFNFPDKESVKYIRLLANRDGFDTALSDFASELIQNTIAKVKTAMAVLFAVSLLAVGVCGGVIAAAGNDIQDAVDQRVNR